MSQRQICRGASDGPTSAIYECCRVNDVAQNMFWLENEDIRQDTEHMLTVLTQMAFFRQIVLCARSFARRPPWIAPIGPSGALRESWCTGVVSNVLPKPATARKGLWVSNSVKEELWTPERFAIFLLCRDRD